MDEYVSPTLVIHFASTVLRESVQASANRYLEQHGLHERPRESNAVPGSGEG